MSKAIKGVLTVTEKVLGEQIENLNRMSQGSKWNVVRVSDEASESLEANYKFRNFRKTWVFLNEVAKEADKFKHHPTITTTYNRVKLSLTTHDAGNHITYKDLKLAQSITNMYVNDFELPQKKASLSELISDTKSKLSISQASQIINELMETHESKEIKTKESEETKDAK